MNFRKGGLKKSLLLLICLGSAISPSSVVSDGKRVGGALAAIDLTPVEVVQKLKAAHEKTQTACVACFMGGSAAAVVISEDGLVATAGHVINLATKKDGEERLATLTFSDGTERKAKPLGCNLVNDMGLFQIVPNEGEESLPKFPCAELIDREVKLGDFCYLWSHPSGKKEGRPAQLRLGRITQIQKSSSRAFEGGASAGRASAGRASAGRTSAGRTWMYYSDLMIQPGDSGAGVFSLDGKLIAIAGPAGAIPRLNRFIAIARLEDDRERMLNGERFGDFDEGPGGKRWSQVSVPADKLSAVTALFQQRVQQRDRYLHEFIRKEATGGELEINPSTLAGVMVPEVFALAAGDRVSDGLEDPHLLAALPFSDEQSKVRPLRLYSGKSPISAVATRMTDQRFITKASEVTDEEGDALPDLAVLVAAGKGIRVTLEKSVEEHDLAILRFADPASALPPESGKIQLVTESSSLTQGSGLMATDTYGQRTWGIACDEARPVPIRISKGPIDDFRISEKRAGFPIAISHNLPLFAQDVGTPIFDFEGRFVGIHIARHSRTLGLILPADTIREHMRDREKESSEN